MFLRWWRMQERRGVWWLYGWFTALMCFGSCVGAVTWALWMRALVLLFTVSSLDPTLSRAQYYTFQSQIDRWLPAFFVTYTIEFLCLSVAKLLVLDRMKDLAVSEADGTARRWVVGGRAVLASVVVGNLAGVSGNFAAAASFKKTADLASSVAAAYAANTTAAASDFHTQWKQQLQVSISTLSIQQFCEVAVLLLIVVAFAVVGIACARFLSAALRGMNDAAGAAGRKVRRQILATCAFVFLTFLLRAVFSTMNALANLLQDNSVDCPSRNSFCDLQCFNIYYFVQYWLLYTPEFQLAIEVISGPLALLVALWGMTSDRALQLMKSSNGTERDSTQGSMLRDTATFSLRGTATQEGFSLPATV